jgi:hypothetical protein
MGTLTGSQASQLSEALRDAFLPDALDELMFFALNRRREDITMAANYRAQVFQLIRSADAGGWIPDLIVAAREARPRNADLQAIAAELGLSTVPWNLERIISESVPFVDVGTWRARLGALEGQVCRVEIRVGAHLVLGTGFLGAADLLITNYHVIEPLLAGRAEPAHARLRFDYRRAADGTVVNPGTEFELADDWLVVALPPSPVDFVADPGGQLPAADELDFAVLRVRGTPGREPVGCGGQVEDSPIRGWVDKVAADGFAAGNPLFLLQHPAGAPLKLAFGPSSGLNANRTRLRHQVNSEGGSSGSPCLNASLELVGLHHAGDPNFEPDHKPAYNSAIPVRAILDYLGSSAVDASLFSPAH